MEKKILTFLCAIFLLMSGISVNASTMENQGSNSGVVQSVSNNIIIEEEKGSYAVTFDLGGHGKVLEEYNSYVGIKSGNNIPAPTAPTDSQYMFDGWYKDREGRKPWDFEKDIVQEDITLYAKWIIKNATEDFGVSEIVPQIYTGKAIKPVVQVYDKNVLLKLNKDYRVTYKNNLAVNTIMAGEVFDEKLPSVIIEGKGKYEGTISLNFNILPATIGNGISRPSEKVKLNYIEQLTVNSKKDQTVFKSISFHRRMKEGIDYEVELLPVNAFDSSGRQLTDILQTGKIPAGASGEFTLIVKGIGNYDGSIRKSIVVKENIADKAQIYTVKCGNNNLILGKDFSVTYY